jgi:iron-sulfur cluster assembly accessory protein
MTSPVPAPQANTAPAISGVTATAGIVVTDRAARRICEIVANEVLNTALRVSVEGGGCSGFQYKFDLVPSTAAADDLVLERGGAIVLIDAMSMEYMAGSQIDFVDDLIGAAFKINNPKAVASCGCGTSFTL